jgi:hypothetical protein
MKIMKISPVTGNPNTRDINVTHEQLNQWRNGELIQNVMPHLTADEREFLISGCTPEDWEKLYGKDTPT